MKIADTISVNPAKTALGHVDGASSSVFRTQVIGRPTSRQSDVLNIFFPATNSGIKEYKNYALPLRTLFATILIVSGLTSLPLTTGFGVCCLTFGTLLAMGLFTRPVMMGASVYFCISGALALRAGVNDISLFSLMFGSLIFCVTGAGKYSCDAMLRNSISRYLKRSENKRKENFMGYKAFHRVKF